MHATCCHVASSRAGTRLGSEQKRRSFGTERTPPPLHVTRGSRSHRDTHECWENNQLKISVFFFHVKQRCGTFYGKLPCLAYYIIIIRSIYTPDRGLLPVIALGRLSFNTKIQRALIFMHQVYR